MRSDDKPDDRPMDRPMGQRPLPEPRPADAMRRDAPQPADRPVAEDQKKAQEQARLQEEKASEEQPKASKKQQPAMKFWRITPVNADEPPFHYSNVSVEMVVSAENEEIARRVAMAEPGGDEAWGDPKTSKVEEWKPEDRGVISRRNV
jgi:hypothetical protein